MSAPPPKPAPRPGRKRVALRALGLAAVFMPLLAVVALWVVTRSWFIILVTASQLEGMLGGDVTIATASYHGNGTLVFEDLVLRVRDLEGPAGQALRIGRAMIIVDLASLFDESLKIENVELDGVLLRISEDRENAGVFNFEGLDPDWSSASLADGPLLPPRIKIHSAEIELGLHGDSEFRRVGHRRVTGEMYPAVQDDRWYDVVLEELDTQGFPLGEAGLTLEGRWNVETLEHTAVIEGLTLDDRAYGMCPQVARLWWQRMQPQGPVGRAEVRWKKGEPYSATLELDSVALNIPIDADAFSASYLQGGIDSTASLPRMYVNSGLIRLDGDRLTLEGLDGVFGGTSDRDELGEMSYRVDFTIHSLPAFDWQNQQGWMQQVLDTAPFEMTVEMDNFKLTQQGGEAGDEEAPAVKLPSQVADLLDKFRLTGWSLTTQVMMTRARPAVAPDGTRHAAPVVTTGTALIEDGFGGFEGFPYPLDNVKAQIEFDNDKVVIHNLHGKGSGEAQLHMTGSIIPPGKDAAISLRLIAKDLPLDDRFGEALKGGQLDAFKMMLHEPSYEALQAEGLLPGPADIDAAITERRRLVAELQALPDDPTAPDRERLEREIQRLRTIEEAKVFSMGGLIDLDLTIERPSGAARATITGTVDIHKAGVVYGRFRYPIHILGGRLKIDKDQVSIIAADAQGPKELPIATPGGGRGTVSGTVGFVAGTDGMKVAPNLSIVLRNDRLSELLYAALPLSRDHVADPDRAAARPGPQRSVMARLLAGAGLSGWVDLQGGITVDTWGRPTYAFDVEIFEAKAEPTDELFETMRELGLPSPKGLRLEAVSASLRVTPEAVTLKAFEGHKGNSRITAHAEVDLKSIPMETQLSVEFENLALERYMVDVTPGASQRTAQLWDKYQPQGSYDAKLDYRARGGETYLGELHIWPRELGITVDEQPVWLICEGGEISLHDEQVTFDGLLMRAVTADREDGEIFLDGSYGLSGNAKNLQLNGSWTGGELASPLIVETLRLLGAQRQADRYQGFSPSGRFDAEFSYESPRDQRPSHYEFTLAPETLGLRIDETPIFADLDEGARITFEPGLIILKDLSGTLAEGRFRVDGRAEVSSPLDINLDLEYHGRIDSPQLLAIVPEALRSTFSTLEIQGAEPVDLTEARLRLIQDEPGGEWETAFSGLLETRGGSLKAAGVEFTEFDGRFDLDVVRDPELGMSLDIRARADRTLANGRELTNFEADISFEDGPKAVSIPAIRADAYNGVITGSVWAGLEDQSVYQIALDIAGVSLEGFAGHAGDAGKNAGNPPRGDMYGSFQVAGRRGVPDSRRGVGAIRVVDGRMIDMPVALRVLQLFELMPPFAGSLDFADVAFYVDGERLVFEKLFLECPTLFLIGEGEMSFPGMELDLRLRTKGTLPLLGDIVAELSDALFLVEVTGPIGDPKARLVPLPGLGQLSTEPTTIQAQAE